MTELALRDYQEECLGAVIDACLMGKKRIAVVLPTGTGKTVIFSHLAERWHSNRLEGRTLILVDRDELVTQAVDKLRMVAPHLNLGIVKAEQNEHAGKDIVVGSAQTLQNLARLDNVRRSGEFGLTVVDECDQGPDRSKKILQELGCFDPNVESYAIGFTATLRSSNTSLGDIWPEVIFRRDILDMIPKYLCNVRGKRVKVEGLSLEQVAMSGGDYQAGSLSSALMSADAPAFIATAYRDHAPDKPGIVFTPSVETAQAFADALCEVGIESRAVWGAMTSNDRRSTLQSAFRGDTQALVNCMVLTRGFDWPRAEVGVIARPTTSVSLYVQMVGRLLRLHPEKNEALILDIVGASAQHRLATLADLTSRRIELLYEGETLLDAVEREQRNANPYLKDYVITWEDVNLFQSSRLAWKKTYKGIWFISNTDWIWFLWPGAEPGLYHVAKRAWRGDTKWHRLHKNVTLDYAMSWAETYAASDGWLEADLVSRNASWRKRSQRPSEKQINFAKQLGLAVPDGINKSDLSDMIDVKLVSRILDKPLGR